MARLDQSLWLATQNVARFRELMASSTDDLQRNQLEELLARELARVKELSGIAGEPVDIGVSLPSDLSASSGKSVT